MSEEDFYLALRGEFKLGEDDVWLEEQDYISYMGWEKGRLDRLKLFVRKRFELNGVKLEPGNVAVVDRENGRVVEVKARG